MNDIQLSIPELLSYDNPLVERNPRKVAGMLSELPLMNPVASVGKMLESLRLLNQQAMPGKERLRLLELYREPVTGVFNTFDNRGLRLVAASPAQRKQLVADVGLLSRELALGYKLLVVQGIEAGRQPDRDEELLTAVARAIEQLGHELVHCFRVYAALPPRIYLELHQLYRFAEGHGAQLRAVAGGPSVAEEYRRLMLTACADPAHLSEGIVLPLYHLLADYSAHCQLLPGREMDPPEGCFVIDLAADAPPVPCAKISPGARFGDPRLMDAREIGQALRARLRANAAGTGGADAESEQRILQPLMLRLESTPLRRSEREAVSQDVVIAIGIPAIQYFLGPEGVQQAQRQAKSRNLGIEVHEESGDETQIQHRLHEATMLDRSEQGQRLQLAGHAEALRVGELIGIGRPGSGDAWRLTLAVVRWLRQNEQGRRELGVELMAGVPSPVICEPQGEAAQFIGRCAGLFLPSQAEPKIAATLITPKKVFSRGRQLQLEAGERTLLVEAGMLVMDSACFDRYTFKSS